MQKNRETNKEKASLRPAPRRLAHFVRLTPSGCVSKAKNYLSLCSSEISSLRSLDSDWVRIQSPLKNNVSRDFLLLYAIAVTQASLRPALAYKSPFNFVEWALCGRGDSNSHARFMSATTSR